MLFDDQVFRNLDSIIAPTEPVPKAGSPARGAGGDAVVVRPAPGLELGARKAGGVLVPGPSNYP